MEPTTPGFVILENQLTALKRWLDDPDISEICVNGPGVVWIEYAGKEFLEPHEDKAISAEYIKKLAERVAGATGQYINSEHPLLSATLPGGQRFQAFIPPVSEQGGFCIRKQVVKDFALEDYEKFGAFSRLNKPASETTALLRDLVQSKKNIVVSGGTSSGKTTFLNALLKEMDHQERIVTIEDARELTPPQKNTLALTASKGDQGEAKVDIQGLLESALRARPDRILLGELRGKEAYSFLQAINTGHPGSITTIHADTPRKALDQIALKVMLSGMGLSKPEIIEFVSSTIDVIIQLNRVKGSRFLTAIEFMEAL